MLIALLVVSGLAGGFLLFNKKFQSLKSDTSVSAPAPQQPTQRSHALGLGKGGVNQDGAGSAKKSTNQPQTPQSSTKNNSQSKTDSATKTDNQSPRQQPKAGQRPGSIAQSAPNSPDSPDFPPKQSNPKPNPSPSVPPNQPSSPVDATNQLRRQIESRYGVQVKYGAETDGYRPKLVSTTALSPDQAESALADLNTVLSRYPTGFFREFASSGMPLTFYLVYSVQGNVFTGFFDREFVNNLKITLVRKDLLFHLTAHHEITHAIDTFMEIKNYPHEPYNEYTALNPPDFKYKTQDAHARFPQYVFNFNNRANAYFTSNYGQVSPREDRAELFKFMMRDRDSLDIFNNTPHLMAKAKVLARQINQNFTTAGPGAYWNRFLK